ncbi:hypothetical protein TWF694_004243 [Orbilia ellipsospora]|uniref:Uncharacterized protein n=1 Tax=Orbilia ellipsospora TaxID=2528407 RepID=A0AAV9WYD9_9PEZI
MYRYQGGIDSKSCPIGYPAVIKADGEGRLHRIDISDEKYITQYDTEEKTRDRALTPVPMRMSTSCIKVESGSNEIPGIWSRWRDQDLRGDHVTNNNARRKGKERKS